ncbi:MAG: nuclear transport factor 2 family protein [Lachnospiraceae bacterium]|jgi:hypothetical protein|nr:nuclear transport factor 2 family protein [Lachnospiraceae bacterium]
MTNKTQDLETMVARWEDQRELKNLMGKYANCVVLNREGELFDLFWAKDDEDVCLAFNDGYYKGGLDVSGYYEAAAGRNALVASLLRDRFPEKLGAMGDDEIYGIGPFKVKPMSCPVIEIAGDGRTAKGLWYCQGASNEVGAAGPVANWTWGYFAVDFVRQNSWRILHLMHVNDVDSTCGQSWGKPQVPYPDLPEFAPLGEFRYPPYTKALTVRPYYSPGRPMVPAPRIPQPYTTFSETFSYGF